MVNPENPIPPLLHYKTAKKIVPVSLLWRKPPQFGQRRYSREQHPLHAVLGDDVLRPDASLHADNMLFLLCSECLRRSVEVVDIGERIEREPPWGLIRRIALTVG